MNRICRLIIGAVVVSFCLSLPCGAVEKIGDPQTGDAVLVTLTSGRSMEGILEGWEADGIRLKLLLGVRLKLPISSLKTVQKIDALTAPTSTPVPTPTPTSTPAVAEVTQPATVETPLPVAANLNELRRLYNRGIKKAELDGKVVELMPDGLFYADLSAYDAEMHALHKHLVANSQVFAPTSGETLVIQNWRELREASENEIPVAVFRGALIFRMPNGLYYWCEEDYRIHKLEQQMRWLKESQQRHEEKIARDDPKPRARPVRGARPQDATASIPLPKSSPSGGP